MVQASIFSAKYPTQDRDSGSYDWEFVRLDAIWPRYDRSAMSATISGSGCILSDWSLTMGRTRGRAITHNWKRLMAKSVAGNRATSGSDHRLIVGQSLRPMTDRTINLGVVWLVARSIVASGDGSPDHSWHHATDQAINRCVGGRIARPSWRIRPIVWLVVPPVAKSCDKSGQVSSSRTTERDVVRRVAPLIVRWHDQLHDQSCHCVIRDNPQLVVRSHTIGGTIT